jgi:CMP-N,N'-diacetyllegionaminic acid synthase
LNFIESVVNESIDILVVMLANSATIKSEWISEAINMIEKDPSITSIVPVYKERDHHPFRAKKIDNEGKIVPYFDFEDDFVSTNRQDLPANYFLSHNFWVLNVNKSIKLNDGFKPWTFLGNKTMPILVEGCFDVYTLEDIEKTKIWLKANNLDSDS